jgi:transketolase
MRDNPHIVVLLGDIGRYTFRETFEKFPDRIYDVGINEQAMVGMAAGLAKEGLLPVVYTIAPFLVERAYEQIMIDLGYQRLKAILVSTGAAYDYSRMGSTHHCPADLSLMLNIPEMGVLVPGTAGEATHLFGHAVRGDRSYYIRLSDFPNSESFLSRPGRARIIKEGRSDVVVFVVGTALREVLPAVEGLDVTVLYYSTLRPFDRVTLQRVCVRGTKLVIVEPSYSSIVTEIVLTLPPPVSLTICAIPCRFITEYGSFDDLNQSVGLGAQSIRRRIEEVLHGTAPVPHPWD